MTAGYRAMLAKLASSPPAPCLSLMGTHGVLMKQPCHPGQPQGIDATVSLGLSSAGCPRHNPTPPPQRLLSLRAFVVSDISDPVSASCAVRGPGKSSSRRWVNIMYLPVDGNGR